MLTQVIKNPGAAVYPKEGMTVAPSQKDTDHDASKLNFPLPLLLTLIGLAITFVAGVWRVEANVSVLSNSMRYERELDTQREKLLDQRFSALEAKIESAGLRNASMVLAQELQKQKER